MDMGGAITAVAATTTVGTAATITVGAIIAIGGDFHDGHRKPASKTKRATCVTQAAQVKGGGARRGQR
jgi:hypothetical protein